MFSLVDLVKHLGVLGWLCVCVLLFLWAGLTFIMGRWSESKWGDRESGALIGFFVPVFLFASILYVI